MKDLHKMTRKELVTELYSYYIKSGSKPIGSDKPLTLKEYLKRYLYGCGACYGFKKDILINLVQSCRSSGCYY